MLPVFELANEHVKMGEDIAWMEELANAMGRPVVFNLSQTDFAKDSSCLASAMLIFAKVARHLGLNEAR